MILFRLSLLFLVVTVACKNTHSGPDPIRLDVHAYADKIGQTPSAQIIDVRTPDEFNEGHLPNATNFNWEDDTFRADVLNFDKTKPVFLYCQGGGRANAAAEYMAKAGFQEVYNLEGGFLEWEKAHMTVVTH